MAEVTDYEVEILLIDDNKQIRDSLRLFLESEGYNLRTAETAEKGLAECVDHQFAMIVSDYKLPGMNGLDLFQWVAELYPGTGTILVSAYLDADVISRAISLGVSEIISKPLTFNSLKQIEKRLEEAHVS